MITKISLKNFKCFKEKKDFNFSKINLLTGINGRGKSSLLQSILLLSQTAKKQNTFSELIFNGEYVNIGNYSDARNKITKRSGAPVPITISISLSNDKSFVLEYYEKEDSSHRKGFLEPNKDKYEDLISHLKKVRYVSADRLGPRKYFEKKDISDFIHVGAMGEFTVNVLGLSQKENPIEISDTLCRGNNSNSLIQQTSEWLSYILDGGEIRINGIEDESSVLYAQFRNDDGLFYNPVNMGYGYSYILPLIVTGLISRPGDSVVIENPEAHLHPSAQSRIIEFMSKVASTGVQFFIESHSEHILNGLRVCALKDDLKISANDINILFFEKNFSISEMSVSTNGKIDKWPDGFFDQTEKDLSEIFKLSHK